MCFLECRWEHLKGKPFSGKSINSKPKTYCLLCFSCGNKFEVLGASKKSKFCSSDVRLAKCLFCGNEYEKTYRAQKYCCKECGWKSIKSGCKYKKRKETKYRSWKKKIHKKDNYTYCIHRF